MQIVHSESVISLWLVQLIILFHHIWKKFLFVSLFLYRSPKISSICGPLQTFKSFAEPFRISIFIESSPRRRQGWSQFLINKMANCGQISKFMVSIEVSWWHVCMYVYMYLCKYVCMIVCKYVCIYVCMYVYMYILCIYVCMYVCKYVCINVCLYICMYICI